MPLPREALAARFEREVEPMLRVANARRVLVPSTEPPWAPKGCAPVVLDASHAGLSVPTAQADVAIIQFTSGSSAQPRGVQVRAESLAANVAMIREWLQLQETDASASWLPLHHDMGLVGQLVTSVCSQITLWLMRPRDFLLDPLRWLECFGVRGATVGAAPNFAYGHVARHVRPHQLRRFEFRRWRAAIAGAERLTVDALASFTRLLEPRGFRPEALRPAYGLAEATLAVTGHRGDAVATVVEVVTAELAFGERVNVRSQETLATTSQTGTAHWLVSSGRPLRSTTVEIMDVRTARRLDSGVLGEVRVTGPGIAAGYVNGAAGFTRFDARRGVYTGDAGFIIDGELFVLGRMGDSINVRGRLVHAEGLELELAESVGILSSRCVVVADCTGSEPCVMAIVESAPGEWERQARRALRRALGPTVAVQVHACPAGTILRTTSGKPCRRGTWERLAATRVAPERATRNQLS